MGAMRRFVNNLEQVLISLFLHCFTDLVVHRRGGRIAARRIAQDKGVVQLNLFHQLPPLFLVLFGLSGGKPRMMSVVIAIPLRASRRQPTRSTYFSAVYVRCIALRILLEPDCKGRWTCSASFGKRANALIKSSRKPIGCGEVKRSRSRPSISCTASSSCTNGVLLSIFGNSWRP